ncbi:MAG TPA: outer membrane beta-barrel protein [Candidatus Binatia bacterium]|nr:outer membrane beta-barrel protein [Candidatus Binatia bacterium]
MKRVGMAVGIALGFTLASFAQENRSEISAQATGLFTLSTAGNDTAYSATDSGGFLGTYRYHLNHWISVEGAYGYSLNTQKYSLSSAAFRIQSGIHDFTGSLVVNLPSHSHSRINPYLLVGGGAVRFAPTDNQFNTLSGAQGQTRGAFVYGAGINYGIYKGLSLRAEYRGMVYSTPDFGFGALATNSVTHTAVPTVGLSFRF